MLGWFACLLASQPMYARCVVAILFSFYDIYVVLPTRIALTCEDVEPTLVPDTAVHRPQLHMEVMIVQEVFFEANLQVPGSQLGMGGL
eukprot:5245158-Amphidinium_carterae.1